MPSEFVPFTTPGLISTTAASPGAFPGGPKYSFSVRCGRKREPLMLNDWPAKPDVRLNATTGDWIVNLVVAVSAATHCGVVVDATGRLQTRIVYVPAATFGAVRKRSNVEPPG